MLTDWRLAAAAASFCTGLLFTCVESNAQAIPRDIAARVEIHAIPSLTISDQQFLTGDANGTPVTMAGELRAAQGDGTLSRVGAVPRPGGVRAGMGVRRGHLNSRGDFALLVAGFFVPL